MLLLCGVQCPDQAFSEAGHPRMVNDEPTFGRTPAPWPSAHRRGVPSTLRSMSRHPVGAGGVADGGGDEGEGVPLT